MSFDVEASSSRSPIRDGESSERTPLLYASDSSQDQSRRKHGGLVYESSSTPQADSASDNEDTHPWRWRWRWHWRFSYIYAILTILSIGAIIALFVFGPNFAQKSMERDLKLQFDKMAILNMTNDSNQQEQTLSVSISGKIVLGDTAFSLMRTTSRIFGNVQSGDTRLTVHQLRDSNTLSDLGIVDLPSLELNRTSNETRFAFVTQFTISNIQHLETFCKDAVELDQVHWQVVGNIPIQVGSVPFFFDAALNKRVSLQGMSGLQESHMESISFPGVHPLGGMRIEGLVGIYNPSNALSLSVGDIDLAIYLPGQPHDHSDAMIAIASAEDVQLQGMQLNQFHVLGRSIPIDNHDVVKKGMMEAFLSSYLHGKTTTMIVRGSPLGPDDTPEKKRVSQTPAWLRKALESVTLRIQFPGTSQKDMIQSFSMQNIKIDFSPIDGPCVSGDIVAVLKKPDEMQFSMNVTQVDPFVHMYLNADSKEPFGYVHPSRPCAATTVEHASDLPAQHFKVLSRLEKAPFKVLPGGDEDFEKFLDKIFNGHDSIVYVQGKADAKVDSAFGQLTVRDLEFKGEIHTKGMGGLTTPLPVMQALVLKKGEVDTLHVQSPVTIYNPSDIDVHLGTLYLSLLYNDTLIGDITVPNVSLLPQTDNELDVHVTLSTHNDLVRQDQLARFITAYIGGQPDVSVTISGNHPMGRTTSPLLEAFLKTLSLSIPVPAFHETAILKHARMGVLSRAVVLQLCNPFENVELYITRINSSVEYKNRSIGSLNIDLDNAQRGRSSSPIVLPSRLPNGTCIVVQTPKLPVTTDKVGMGVIKEALDGQITVNTTSDVSVSIDQFSFPHILYTSTATVSVHLNAE